MRSRSRRWLGNLALMLASVIVSLLLLEWAVRAFGNVERYGYPPGLFVAHPAGEFRYAPNFGPAPLVKQEFTTQITSNSLGFRDREHGPKEDNVYRILSLGDSFVWAGYGVELERSYSALIEAELDRRWERMKCEVVSAGVVAWGTDNELDFLVGEGYTYEPDMVLLSFCIANDFFDNLERGELTVRDGNLVSTASTQDPSLLKRVRRFVLRHSLLYTMMERGAMQIPATQALLQAAGMKRGELLVHNADRMQALFSLSPESPSTLGEATARLLEEMASFCKVQGIELVVFAVPAQFQVEDAVRSFIAERYELDPANTGAPQEFLRAVCAALGVHYIDPLAGFREAARRETLYWRLNPHFNEAGNAAAARAIVEALSALEIFEAAAPAP